MGTWEGIHKYLWVDRRSQCAFQSPRSFLTSEWLSSISTNIGNRCRSISKSMLAALLKRFHSFYPSLLIVERNSMDFSFFFFFFFASWRDAALCLNWTWIKQVVCGKSSGLPPTHTRKKKNIMPTRNRGTRTCQLSYQQPSERKEHPSHRPPPALCKLFLGHPPPSSGKSKKRQRHTSNQAEYLYFIAAFHTHTHTHTHTHKS